MISDQLKQIGIIDPIEIIYNPSFDKLYEEETLPELTGYEKSQKTEYGALNVKTEFILVGLLKINIQLKTKPQKIISGGRQKIEKMIINQFHKKFGKI